VRLAIAKNKTPNNFDLAYHFATSFLLLKYFCNRTSTEILNKKQIQLKFPHMQKLQNDYQVNIANSIINGEPPGLWQI